MADIYNYDSDSLVTGTAEADFIYNGGSNVTIEALAGNDTINNYGASSLIDAGDDNDYITSSYNNVSVNAGAGDDSIQISGNNVIVLGGEGNDFLYDGGVGTAYVYSGGNDTLSNFNEYSTLVLGGVSILSSVSAEGTVALSLSNDNSIVLTNYYSDKIETVASVADVQPINFINKYEPNTVVTGTAGRDSIYSNGEKVTINALAGNDYITSYGDDNSINAEAGNDIIQISGNNVTIAGGAGNDSLYDGGVGTAYVYSGGNDTLSNFKTYSTLVLGGVSILSSVSSNGIVTLGLSNDNSIVLTDYYSDKVETVASVADVQPINFINKNFEPNTVVTGTAGRDSIYSSGEKVTINALAGNDYINSYGDNASINLGVGNDFIEISGNNVTIAGGAGNDSLYDGGVGTAYVYSGGNDTLSNFKECNTLVLGGVSILSSVSSNGIVTLGLSNDNSIVLTNYSSNKVETVASVADVQPINFINKNFEPNTVITGTAGRDSIYSSGDKVTINALAGNDYITSYGDDNLINAEAGNDVIQISGNNVTVAGGAGNDSLHDGGVGTAYVYSGGNDTLNNFKAYSTLVLGGISILSSVSSNGIVTLGLSNDNSIVLPNYYSDKVETVAAVADVQPINFINSSESDATVTGTNGRDSIYSSGDKVTINAGEGNDIISSYGASAVVNSGDGNDDISAIRDKGTLNGGNGDDTLVNSGDDALISGGTGNDDILNSGGFNVTVEGGSGNDYFYESGYGTAYVYSGGDDTLYSFNDTGTIVLGGVSILSSVRNGSNNYILNLDNGNTIFLQNYYSSTVNTVASVSEVERITVIRNSELQTLITGTALRDSIYNGSDNVSIGAGAGKDTIINYGASATLNGQDDDDYITNYYYATNSTILGGAGNDSINNNGDGVLITGGAGNDSIYNSGYNIGASGGEGDDNINNSGFGSYIAGAEGNDSIFNSGEISYVDGGEGNDSITNSGVNVTVAGGEGDDIFREEGGIGTAYVYGSGNDTLQNFGSVDTLVFGGVSILSSVQGNDGITLSLNNGNSILLTNYINESINTVSALEDTEPFNLIINSSKESLVTGTADKDYIRNTGDSSTLLGDAGTDYIYNGGDNVSLDAGIGNDTILNYGESSTITGGEGSDSIINESGENVSIDGGEGDDIISNYDNNVTASGSAGSDYIYNGGVNFTVIDDEGNDTFREAGVGTAYVYGGGSDTLQNFTGFDALILGDVSINSSVESEEDNVKYTTLTLSNGGSIVLTNYSAATLNTFATLDEYERYNIVEINYDQYSIAGTSGKDYISTWRDNATIDALAGNDYVYNGGDSVSADLGDGDDYLYNYGDNVSVTSGEGNDTIYNSGGVNFTVIDDASDDIFRENGIGTAYVYGGGSDTLENFTGLDALILGGLSIVSSVKGDDNVITLNISNGNSIILTNYDSDSINALASLDDYERFNIIRNSYEFAAVEGTDGKDYIFNYAYNSTINGNAGDDYIYNSYSDVSINGGAGKDSIRTYAENVTTAGGEGDDAITISSYYENNLVEYAPGDGNDTIYGFGNNATLAIAGGSYASSRSMYDLIFTVGDGSIVLKNGATLSAINVSDGTETTVIENEPFAEHMTLTNDSKSPITFQADVQTADASKRTKAIQITGNELDNSITGGKGNDSLDGAEGNDVLTGGKGKDLFVFSGGNDTLTDYENKDKLSIGGGLVYEDYAIDGEDLILNFGNDNDLTIIDGADKIISYLEDKKTITDKYNADGVILDGKKKSATLTSAVEKFDASSSKDYSKVVTIDGSATGAIEITGNKKKNYIIAGASGSTLNGKKGNDSLIGNAGADLFVYENKSGKDVIEGYGEGDAISLDSKVTIKDAKTKSGDTVLKFKGGALTVKDTTEFTFGAGENETLYSGGVFVADDTAKVYGSFKGSIDLSAYNVANADASEGKKKLTIAGNDSANSLTGGKGKDSLFGNAGDDTLNGGKGNDKLWGGDGADTFIFQAGDGKDTIMDYDFAQGDLLTILNKKGDAGDFKKATFKKDTLTLSINGGGKVAFSGVEASTSININGTARTVSDLAK